MGKGILVGELSDGDLVTIFTNLFIAWLARSTTRLPEPLGLVYGWPSTTSSAPLSGEPAKPRNPVYCPLHHNFLNVHWVVPASKKE